MAERLEEEAPSTAVELGESNVGVLGRCDILNAEPWRFVEQVLDPELDLHTLEALKPA